MPGNPSSAAGDPSTDAIPAAISDGERYKTMSPGRLPIARSPCAAIPSGFSPTAMIESPVFLTNIKAEPSPTTGTFAMPLIMNGIGSASLCSPKNSFNSSVHEDGSSHYFQFRPPIRSSSRPGLSALTPLASVGSNSKQLELSGKNQSPLETQQPSPSQLVKTENIAQPSHELALSVNRLDSLVEVFSAKSVPTVDASNELQQTNDAYSSAQAAQTYSNGSTIFSAVEKSVEDGYSWRKYGQKHVKGCEFPRSYYKCTHHNCQMKKLLERSHDGQVTEIIYKGRHDHPMPQQTRRSAVTAIFTSQREEKEDGFSSLANPEENFSNAHGQASHHVCPIYNSELSPVSVSDDEVDVRGVQAGLGDEVAGADDDLQSKRRKMDATAVEANSIAKNNREPRVVVQTVSEVDILDDGYRWRKYGQKVVKGNPNPRSYYKCTNPGCSVRKHVERASHDPKAVITAYEGKHNHDVPAAKTSGSQEASAPMITDAKTAFGNHLPAALGSMPRTCNSHQYPQPGNSISLHLGVGISSNHSSTLNDKQHIPGSELVQSRHQLHYVGSDNRKPLSPANPMSKLYGISNNAASGYTEKIEKLSLLALK